MEILSSVQNAPAPMAARFDDPEINEYGPQDTISDGIGEYDKFESIDVLEPCDENIMVDILNKFHDYLTKRVTHAIGCPVNQNCHHYLALSPFLKFHLNNIGDPFKDSANGLHSKKFERGVLDWFGQLWGLGKDEHWGYITNGGTEGNLHAILLGRELFPDGVLYTSKDSHYSIVKAARMYRMDCVMIETLASGEMDCAHLKNRLLANRHRPAIINVIIGTTFKGGIDNLDLVVKTLEEDCGFSQSQYYIHCDAAISGFMIPFLNEGLNYNFKKPIGSLTISGHKFLGSPMPCGLFLTRKTYVNVLSQDIEYIATLDTTISGSRNGHAPMFMWYSLSINGHIGFDLEVQKCLKNARYLRDRLKDEGLSTMLNEASIIVVFERPLDDEFVDLWQLQCLRDMAHIVVMPHVTMKMLDLFLDDLMRRRKVWYQSGKIEPPCLAEDMGVFNCSCSVHGKGKK